MLPKQYRISRKEMRLVLRSGVAIRQAAFKLLSLPLPSGKTAKIGFVVPKRVEKTAVGRHKIKRYLRGAWYALHKNFVPAHGYVFVVEQKIIAPSEETILPIIEQLVKRSTERKI
ncbi:MAG: ribonuclease P protein component [Patescibacteria group bacterium]